MGVAAGGSSAIILNAIKDIDDAFLYSVDKSNTFYRDRSKLCGFVVPEYFNHLSNKWKLYLNGTIAKFIDEIGGDIDLCLLDAAHVNPGEFIDFLVVLPYLKKNAIVIIHDIRIPTTINTLNCVQLKMTTCGTLFSCIKGKKYYCDKGFFHNTEANIGAIVIDEDIFDHIFDYFYLLTLPWEYKLTEDDIEDILKCLSKHYEKEYVDMFLNAVSTYCPIIEKEKYNVWDSTRYKVFEEKNKFLNIENKLNNILNLLIWFVPFKKKRDEFRKKFDI